MPDKIKNKNYPYILVSLLFLVIIKQLLWSSFIPLWQFPDEQAHFAQVQNYAEGNPINPTSAANTSKEIDESEKYLGTKRDGFGNNKFIYHPEFNTAYSSISEGLDEKTIKTFPISFRKEFITNEATAYPPLYYKISAIFYQVVYPKDLITRVFITRLLNILFFLSLAFFSWLIGKLLFPRQIINQITLVLLVSFHPMLSFLGGGVNSDNLFILEFTICLYLGLRLLQEPWTIKKILLVGLMTMISLFTKEMGRLVPLVFLYPSAVWIVKNKNYWKKILVITLVIIGVFTIAFYEPMTKFIKGEQFISDVPNWRVLTSTARESYVEHLTTTAVHTYREVIPWYWGVFRWLSLTYPRPVHRIINWILVLSTFGIGLAVMLSIYHKALISRVNLGFLIYVSCMYFLAITTYDYLFKISHGFSIGIQGRYFFPTIVTHMALIQIGIMTIASKTKKQILFVKILGLAMILFHGYAIIFVSRSYYSWPFAQFFLQASQYKPWFFKTPFLQVYAVLFVVLLLIFCAKYIKLNHEKN